ncbi:MAG TPA: hypothetical protein VHY37_00615, partial [Tepidisphaeraceae bacterium]|nr:hypothetical protein [Tepidisphaeraceae bacterium]
PFVLFGWIPVVLLIFWLLPARRAIIVAFIGAWLFLPVASFHVAGIPSYDKMTATCGGVLLAALIFDCERLKQLSFFPSWVDLAMIVWCLVPVATAMSNDPELTMHDGTSWMLGQIFTWGLPYLIGRIYLADLTGLRELAIGVFIGGLIYVPLCLFEIRFSPQLHRWVYGYYQNDFGQTLRFGGYRPTVFMQHGLAVGLYMCGATLCGFWLWKTGAMRKLGDFSMPVLLVPLAATLILCKSVGAIIFCAVGVLAMYAYRWLGSIALIALLAAPLAYVTLRTIGDWNGEGMPPLIAPLGAEKVHSLMYRFENERGITAHAMERPWLGWGGYARPFLHDSKGKILYTPDSLWVIAFGTNGVVGLISLLLLTMPVVVLLLRLPAAARSHPAFSGVTIFCLLLALFAMDNMMNDFVDPIFILALGGLCSLARSPYLVPAAIRPGVAGIASTQRFSPLINLPVGEGTHPN